MNEKRTPDVRVGQIWADNDPRSHGRRIEIVEIGLTKKRRTNVAPWLESRHGVTETNEPAVRVRVVNTTGGVPSLGRETVVLLSRFRPTATGYVLNRDSEPTS